jgi:hypothetical protein
MKRREFVGLLAGVSVYPATRQGDACALQELGLPPEALGDLQRSAQGAIEAAQSLKELPLDNVSPAFSFTPR